MHAKWILPVQALLCGALLSSLAAHAGAQVSPSNTSPTGTSPTAPSPTATSPTTTSPTTRATSTAATSPTATSPATQAATDAEALPQTVPSYQPTQYELTPPGSAAEGRSETRRWPNRPLMVTSTLMFTAAYVPAVITAAINEDDTTDNLYIPVAGPWLEFAREPASKGNKALLAVSGVFQDLGALGMLTSLLVPERTTSRWYLIGNQRFSAAPVADRFTYGVSARGQF